MSIVPNKHEKIFKDGMDNLAVGGGSRERHRAKKRGRGEKRFCIGGERAEG